MVEATNGIVREGLAGSKERVLVENLIRLFRSIVLGLLLHTDLVLIRLAGQSHNRHYGRQVIHHASYTVQSIQQNVLALLNMTVHELHGGVSLQP